MPVSHRKNEILYSLSFLTPNETVLIKELRIYSRTEHKVARGAVLIFFFSPEEQCEHRLSQWLLRTFLTAETLPVELWITGNNDWKRNGGCISWIIQHILVGKCRHIWLRFVDRNQYHHSEYVLFNCWLAVKPLASQLISMSFSFHLSLAKSVKKKYFL